MKAVYTIFIFAIIAAGCSKPPADDYMKKAREAEKSGLWSVAIENYQLLAKDHPENPLAQTALFSIAAIQQNGLQNSQAAIDGYKSYLDKYPDGEKAATALFLTGFLYHNELKNLDSAKVFYQRFLAKYPQHEMAASAQFELQNLGKSPDEILPKPVVAETTPEKSATKSATKSAKPSKKN